MLVLIDTSAWPLALRRPEHRLSDAGKGRVAALRDPDEPLTTEDYGEAASWSNECRPRGVAG